MVVVLSYHYALSVGKEYCSHELVMGGRRFVGFQDFLFSDGWKYLLSSRQVHRHLHDFLTRRSILGLSLQEALDHLGKVLAVLFG